jgi:TonB family protein
LQADPKFVRTEYVLGQLAYLHRQDIGFVEETYFVPELGPFPFKRINHHTSFKRVEDPVSLTFGEPERAQFRGVDYPLIEQKPTYDANLSRRLQEKPEPHYPPEAIAAGILGEVVLQVIIDESGWVMRAAVVSCPPLLAEAAMEAASRARFAPSKWEGSPVTFTGVITYWFAPRPSSNKRIKLTP